MSAVNNTSNFRSSSSDIPQPVTGRPGERLACSVWRVRRVYVPPGSEALHVLPLEHGCGGFLQLIGSTHLVEPVEQMFGGQFLLFGTAEIVQDPPAHHHDEPVAQARRLRARPGATPVEWRRRACHSGAPPTHYPGDR